jgi:hypothetical protein
MYSMLVPEHKNPPETDTGSEACPVSEISIVDADLDDAGDRAVVIEPATIDDELWGALVETWEPGKSVAPVSSHSTVLALQQKTTSISLQPSSSV